MNLLQFVVIKLTFFLVIGILLGYFTEMDPVLALLMAISSLGVMGFLHFKSRLNESSIIGLCAAVATVFAGMATSEFHRAFQYTDQLKQADQAQSHLWKLKIKEELNPGSYYKRYIAEVETFDQQRSGGVILCRAKLNSSLAKIAMDDELLVRARPYEIKLPLNPHQFNYKRYLYHLGIEHQIDLKETNFLHLAQKRTTLTGLANRARNNLIDNIEKLNFGQAEMSVIQALLLGYRKAIDENTHRNYKYAGALHILAVSGLHVGIILLYLHYLLKPLELLPKGRILKLISCVILLWAFAFLAGFSASVVRAVTMYSFVAYALYLNRPGSSFNILALSIFFMLLVIDPMLLFQVGFQLSYAAVFSILWIYPKLIKYWNPGTIILKKAWQMFAVGLSAQAGVLPLTLFYFHQFPGLFFLSNILVVPFVGIILGMGIAVVILSLLASVPDYLVSVYNSLVLAMNETVAWIASQQNFVISDIYFDHLHLILTVALLVFLVRIMYRFETKRIFAALLCILAIQFWNHYTLFSTSSSQYLSLVHRVGVTALFYQTGSELRVITDDPEQVGSIVDSYKTAERIETVSFEQLNNVYKLKESRLLLIDNNYKKATPLPAAKIILLSNSPSINLDRILTLNPPELIVADGSNYTSYVSRWRRSCFQQNIPFHHTGTQGALRINLK